MWGVLPDVFDRACAYHRDSVAIIDADRSLTYHQMYSTRNQIANALIAIGVGKGQRVGLLMPNTLEFIPCQHGIWATGATMVQMTARASSSVFLSNLAQTGATTLIYHAKFDSAVAEIRENLPKLRQLIRVGGSAVGAGNTTDILDFDAIVGSQPVTRPSVDIGEHDESYIMFTSGSTGAPKAVLHTHFTWAHTAITPGLGIADIRPGEVFAHGAPLTHYSGAFVMPTFVQGGTNVMLPGMDVQTLLTGIQSHRVTATAVVPTIIYLLLDDRRRDDFDVSSLHTMVYAGSPISPERLRQALEVFGPIFVQTYAGTEQGFVSCLRKHEHRMDTTVWKKRLGSAGRPLFPVQVQIRDDDNAETSTATAGEICTRQTGQMTGYLDPATNHETLINGWVHTGDIGRLDDDGFLYLMDRKKDMVVSGGFNVFPSQVEDALSSHHAVAACAVIGIPDPKWGEMVLAVVVAKSGMSVTERELIDHVKTALGSVAAPKAVVFVDSLPTVPTGKVDKKAIREPYWREHDRQIG